VEAAVPSSPVSEHARYRHRLFRLAAGDLAATVTRIAGPVVRN